MNTSIKPAARVAHPAIAAVITLHPVVKFCNQCGKVFEKSHADCRGHVPAEFAAPRCPQGQTEHWYGAGPGVKLVCHLDIDLGEAETKSCPAWPAKAELRAAYLNGADVLDALLSPGLVALIEEDALKELQT